MDARSDSCWFEEEEVWGMGEGGEQRCQRLFFISKFVDPFIKTEVPMAEALTLIG